MSRIISESQPATLICERGKVQQFTIRYHHHHPHHRRCRRRRHHRVFLRLLRFPNLNALHTVNLSAPFH